MFKRTLLAIPAALLLAACGGGDNVAGPGENPNQSGSFTGSVSGGLAKSVTGEAVFGTSQSEGGFALMLGNDDDGFIFGRELAGIPGTGTYNVWDLTDEDEGEEEQEIPQDAISGVFGLTIGSANHICYSTGGTITITSSSSTRLAGNLNVTATCYNGATAAATNITLTGQFNGVGGEVD